MANEILFLNTWVNGLRFEQSLGRSQDPHRTIENVLFRFPHSCKIMVDAGIRLLCLANQLQYVGKIVTLVFDEGASGTQGYLDRMGFFDLLHPEIRVMPNRPYTSTADIYRGENPSLVEFRAINPKLRQLPNRTEQHRLRPGEVQSPCPHGQMVEQPARRSCAALYLLRLYHGESVR